MGDQPALPSAEIDSPTVVATRPEKRKLIARFLEWYNNQVTTRFHRFIGIHLADIPLKEREICEQYGEQAISTFLAGGFSPVAEDLRYLNTAERRSHSRDWLAERCEIRDFRDRWIPLRDLLLEIVVIALIGWEIHVGAGQDRHQSEDFDKQQQVLTSMQSSSEATAKTLGALESTTETMKVSVERNANASEATSKTASQSLYVSERAYVAGAVLAGELKEGEKLRATITMQNSGKTPAIDFEGDSYSGLMRKTLSLDEVRKVAFSARPNEGLKSRTILGPGQTFQQFADSGANLTTTQITSINDGTMIWYVFAVVQYKDTFNHPHSTATCTYYDPDHKTMMLCGKFNSAD